MDIAPAARVRIREAREARGLSVADLMRRSGMAPGQIAKLEKRDADPRVSTVARIADALGCSVAELIGQ